MISNNEREIILSFCEKKFLTEGFVKVTMDEIAKELGISKKTIYKHFTSKDILVSEIVHIRLKNAHSNVMSVLSTKADAVRKFIELINVYTYEIRGIHPKWFREIELHKPDLWKEIDNFRSKLINNYLPKVITQGIRQKLIKSYSPELIILAFTSLSKEIMNTEFLINSKQSLEEIIRETFDMLFGGLLTKKGLAIFSKDKKFISK